MLMARATCPFSRQAAEKQVNFQRVAERFGGLAELFDGEVDLVRDEEIEAQDVVQRFGRAAPIDQPACAKLVAFPRFADRESQHQADERGDKREVGAQNKSVRHKSWR